MIGMRDNTTGRCVFLFASKESNGKDVAPGGQAISSNLLREFQIPSFGEGEVPLPGFEHELDIAHKSLEAALDELSAASDRVKAGFPPGDKEGLSARAALAKASRNCIQRVLATSAAMYTVGGESFVHAVDLEKAVVERYLDILAAERELRSKAAVALRAGARLSARIQALGLKYEGTTPETLEAARKRLQSLQQAVMRIKAQGIPPYHPERPAGVRNESPASLLSQIAALKRELRRREARILSLAEKVGTSRSSGLLLSQSLGSKARWAKPVISCAEFLDAHPLAKAAAGPTVGAAKIVLGGVDHDLDEFLHLGSDAIGEFEVEES